MAERDVAERPVHRQWVQTKGALHEGTLRFLGRCSCSWSTGWFLSAMQAWSAVEDHAPCLTHAGSPEGSQP